MSREPAFKGSIGQTYKTSEAWWPEPAAAPTGAPNIITIVLDDVGFSDLGCYGSEIATPHMDSLAARGLRYSNFHVTSMCSPTRACLLTGRNAHAVGVGIIAEWSSGFPGYQGKITRRAATIPEVLRDHAYGTYAVGKWHLTNIADYGSAGPHGDWPIGRGFGRWYGFHGALTDQWNPELYQDNRPIQLAAMPDYHLSTDLVDHVVGDIRDHVATAPERPFFHYLAFGACHWPHHVPRAYIDRYRGRYDAGWDIIRERRIKRQLELGIIPKGTTLAPRNPGVEAWVDMAPDVRRLLVRLQETYAGFLEHTDAEIGRLVAYLDGIGQLDNTMIILISDNGASPEGGPTGAINLRKHMVYEEEPPSVGLAMMDKIGSEYAFNHYPQGWAQVSNTPLKWYKKDTHGGGIRAPLIVQWPKRITNGGAIRTQYHHVSDIAPTLYEILRVEPPQEYRGAPQLPIHGTSLAYTFDDGDAPTRKRTQYFELLGDRAIWHQGWKAVSRHVKGSDFEADQWELYHLDQDFAEIDDKATAEPGKLRALVDLWWVEAGKYGVLPLDDRDWERAAARLRMSARTRYTYFGDMARVDRLSSPDISDRSYTVTAAFDVVAPATEGVLIAWGSRFAGFTIFIRGGQLNYQYVYSESVKHTITAPFAAAPGPVVIRLAFRRRAKNMGRAELFIADKLVGALDIPKTWPTHGTTAGLNVGLDAGAPVSDDYVRPFRLTAQNLHVTVELEGPSGDQPGAAYHTVLREQ